MKYVLGIDAAWSEKNPSGVALIQYELGQKPSLIRAGRSYEEFIAGEVIWENRVHGSRPNFSDILTCCPDLEVIALDIPLAPYLITGRREADQAISREYVKFKAAAHSPTKERPGKLAKDIFEQLINLGFHWATVGYVLPAFIEVYPHATLIELFNLTERWPYKVGKRAKYWPNDPPPKRIRKIISSLKELTEKLSQEISGLDYSLRKLNIDGFFTIGELKGYEDLLDAVVSALTGYFYLESKSRPFGNDSGAVWVPKKKGDMV